MSRQINKFPGNPSYYGTGYAPYYPVQLGHIEKAPTRDLNLEKVASLDLDENFIDGKRRLKAMDFDNNKITYSPLGSVVSGVLNKEQEAMDLKFDCINNQVSLDFISARGEGYPEIYEILNLENLKESQKELIKFLLRHRMINIPEEYQELGEEMGVFESTWTSED